jgi:DNA-binding FrmR family transcriptional regulator
MPQKKKVVPITSQTKASLLARLRTIEGHVRGILRMVEGDAYCPEILAQAQAVQRAIDRFTLELLEHHLETCFVSAVRSDNEQGRMQALREILDIFQTSAKLKRTRHPQTSAGDDGVPQHQRTCRTGPSRLVA